MGSEQALILSRLAGFTRRISQRGVSFLLLKGMIGLKPDCLWLYRGVPKESPEVKVVIACGEVRPPRPDLAGPEWLEQHIWGGATDTAYTSWTSDKSFAVAAAEAMSEDCGLSGQVRIFRVSVASIEEERFVEGREDESEWLIQGIVEDVSVTTSTLDEDDSDE